MLSNQSLILPWRHREIPTRHDGDETRRRDERLENIGLEKVASLGKEWKNNNKIVSVKAQVTSACVLDDNVWCRKMAQTLTEDRPYSLQTSEHNNEKRLVYYVKLTDSCLKAIEEHITFKVSYALHLSIL